MAKKNLSPQEAETVAASDKATGLKSEDLQERGTKWLTRIKRAEDREAEWMEDALAAEHAYTAGSTKSKRGKVPEFNILHSNVETIVPAIYNSTPVPDIRSRHTLSEPQDPPQPSPEDVQQDPQAAQMYQQAQQAVLAQKAKIKAVKDLCHMMESGISIQIDDNKLDSEIESNAQDGFCAGRGIVRVRFFAAEGPKVPRVTYEAVSWRDYRHGPAKRWSDIPWEAYRSTMAQEEIERITDKEVLQSQMIFADKGDQGGSGSQSDDEDITVWEIWCKGPDGNYVEFVREHDGMILKRVEDPLGLPNFFPRADPLQPISLTGDLTPVCPSKLYAKLAAELDIATQRISAITKGLKVRGLVAGIAADVARLAEAGDNELVVMSDMEALATIGDLNKAVMFWPVEQAVKVLAQLYTQREMCKQAIYEITGISDIVRGASSASETATAQQIKTQWGSLRIQKMQRLIQRQVRDLFVITAHLLGTLFEPEHLQTMTGVEITPDIQALLDDPQTANLRIDIESDSTVRADTQRIKAESAEMLAGTAQFFGAMAPLVQIEPRAAGPIAKLFGAFSQAFNLGKAADDAIDELVTMADAAGQEEKPNPEAEAAAAKTAAETKKLQDGMMQSDQQHQQKMGQDKQAHEQKMHFEQETHDYKMKQTTADLALEKMRLVVSENEKHTSNVRDAADRHFKAKREDEVHQATIEAKKGEHAMKADEHKRTIEAKDVEHKQTLESKGAEHKQKTEGALAGAGVPPDFSFEKIVAQMGKTEAVVAEMVSKVGDGLATVAESNKMVAKAIAAPTEIDRDPKTGKALRGRKVMEKS